MYRLPAARHLKYLTYTWQSRTIDYYNNTTEEAYSTTHVSCYMNRTISVIRMTDEIDVLAFQKWNAKAELCNVTMITVIANTVVRILVFCPDMTD